MFLKSSRTWPIGFIKRHKQCASTSLYISSGPHLPSMMVRPVQRLLIQFMPGLDAMPSKAGPAVAHPFHTALQWATCTGRLSRTKNNPPKANAAAMLIIMVPRTIRCHPPTTSSANVDGWPARSEWPREFRNEDAAGVCCATGYGTEFKLNFEEWLRVCDARCGRSSDHACCAVLPALFVLQLYFPRHWHVAATWQNLV